MASLSLVGLDAQEREALIRLIMHGLCWGEARSLIELRKRWAPRLEQECSTVTLHMRFVKYLVQTGRLTDFPSQTQKEK